MPQFSDDENTLPHGIDTSRLEHFEGVHIPVVPDRRHVHVLIGQCDKTLLTILEERESIDPEEPNYVLTRLGPIASGRRIGSMSKFSDPLSTVRINIGSPVSNPVCDNIKVREENSGLKQLIREYELMDETVQPSKNDECAFELTEPKIAIKDGRYQITVTLKSEELENLRNNFDNALTRTLSLRKTAMRNPELKQTPVGTFKELIDEQWIEPVDVDCVKPMWYLPYFVTKTTKPRVVYDGSAVFDGMSLNQVVLAGENLLNNLVEVLIRFRLGKFACVADLSKCFFQVKIPSDQRDLFRLIWFYDSEMLSDNVQVYRFTRYVWGINSSPFVPLLAVTE